MEKLLNTEVKAKFDSYPAKIRKALQAIRDLILEVAKQCDLGQVEETLKWGEPSYLVKGGSTVRMGWQPNRPNEYAVYFHCKTKLVDTFKEIYGNEFSFEGSRAIIISVGSSINRKALKHCIELSLKYHKLKHLPLLGG